MNAYKILSIVLGMLVLVAGGLFLYERYAHKQDRVELGNQIAKLEGTIKETETTYSKRALQIEDLKSDNEKLQRLIEERDEEIFATSELAFQWKDKYFKIKNSKQSIEPKDPSPSDVEGAAVSVVISEDCQKCISEYRVRVDFEHVDDPIKVSGFTKSNPPETELKLEWTRSLKLDLALARNDDGSFRLYVDSENSDVSSADLVLRVDPTIFDYKWYERIGIGFDFNIGEDGVLSGVRVFYDITENFYVGPNIAVQIGGLFRPKIYYGATLGWYPFR